MFIFFRSFSVFLFVFSILSCGGEEKFEFLPLRGEELGSRNYYWIEAERFVPAEARYGAWERRGRWTRRRNGLANDSDDFSLISPVDNGVDSVGGMIGGVKPGSYNLWVRVGSFAQWPQQGFSVFVDDCKYRIAPLEKRQLIDRSFVWVRVNADPVYRERDFRIVIKNDLDGNLSSVIDCFLLTNDLVYVPPSDLPRRGHFSVLPYSGPVAVVDFWHPAKLDVPVYVCQSSIQHFLLRVRNLSDFPLSDFTISIKLPLGISVIDPSRNGRWLGDDEKFKSPHFVSLSPDAFERRDRKDGSEFLLRYNNQRSVRPYDIYSKSDSLFFVALDVSDDARCGDDYNVVTNVFGSDGDQIGMRFIQDLSILPKLNGVRSDDYQWGVDAIYFSFLSPQEQVGILNTFKRSSVNVWASRIRENSPRLRERNRDSWKLARKVGDMNVINWSEWFWPGSPHTSESLEYVQSNPRAMGVHRDDDRGRSLSGKLICPSHLVCDEGDIYIRNHMERVCGVLRDAGISVYVEDAEYSSPLSFCFCERCIRNFSLYSNIRHDAVSSLSPDEIVNKYQKKWIDFRCHQNSVILKKIGGIAHALYPQIEFNVFCGYPSFSVRKRYGIDWPSIVSAEEVDGVYVGGGMPGTPPQIMEMMELAGNSGKKIVSMANATLSFPHGFDELTFRNQAYLESRVVHDLMCGSRGLFIWWWGTLDGRCLKAFELGARISDVYGDVLRCGIRSARKIGLSSDLYFLKCSSPIGSLYCVSNPSRYTDDRVVDIESLANEFPAGVSYCNVVTSAEESRDSVIASAGSVYRQGAFSLWFSPSR